MSLRLVPATPREHDLPQLLLAVATGDEDAFRLVHDLTTAYVDRVVRRTLRQPDLAAEVVQDVLLHVWQHAGTYEPARGSVHAWLAMHAHRRAVDRLRQVVRMAARDQRDVDERAAEPGDDVAEMGIARCDAARVRGALGEITALQRQAVELTFLQGYSHAQAATVLNIPLGTVKTRVRSGLISLRHRMDPVAAA